MPKHYTALVFNDGLDPRMEHFTSLAHAINYARTYLESGIALVQEKDTGRPLARYVAEGGRSPKLVDSF